MRLKIIVFCGLLAFMGGCYVPPDAEFPAYQQPVYDNSFQNEQALRNIEYRVSEISEKMDRH